MRSSIKLRSPLEISDDDVLVFEPDKRPRPAKRSRRCRYTSVSNGLAAISASRTSKARILDRRSKHRQIL